MPSKDIEDVDSCKIAVSESQCNFVKKQSLYCSLSNYSQCHELKS